MTDKEIKEQIKVIKKAGKEVLKSKRKCQLFLKKIGLTSINKEIKEQIDYAQKDKNIYKNCKVFSLICWKCGRYLSDRKIKTIKGCIWCDFLHHRNKK